MFIFVENISKQDFYEYSRKIDSGAFGTVYEVRRRDDNEIFAIKKFESKSM